MATGKRMRVAVRGMAVGAAAAGLLVGTVGSADASGGTFAAVLNDSCGSAYGDYYWWYQGKVGGRDYYDTSWDFYLLNQCGVAISLYTTYEKWTGDYWKPYSNYTRIGSEGSGNNVRNVKIYLCKVGSGSSCVPIESAS